MKKFNELSLEAQASASASASVSVSDIIFNFEKLSDIFNFLDIVDMDIDMT